MGVLGSGLVGLGNVQVAGEPPGGGSSNPADGPLWLTSNEVDCHLPPAVYAWGTNWPAARPGYVLVPIYARFVSTLQTSGQVANPQILVGSTANHVVLSGTNIAAGTINNQVAAGIAAGSNYTLATSPNPFCILDGVAPTLVVNVSSTAAFKGRVQILGFARPASQFT